MTHDHRRRTTAAFLLAALAAAGCSKPPAPQAPPPSEVIYTMPVQREVMEWDEYIGHLESPETANVTARVSGFIMKARFDEGAMVQKDDVLFTIDDRLFKAAVDSAVADVKKAQSQADQAKVHLDRYASVRGTKAISEDDYDSAKASYDQALALLAAAQAAEETANLNLKWTKVTAPISGRISRKFVTDGNQVNGGTGAAPATLLTTILSVDPMYCYVAVPERSLLKSGQLAMHKAGVKCFIQLENETNFPHQGMVDFLDNTVDPATGTIQLRAVLSNDGGKGVLTPGLFARLRLPAGNKHQAILVPDLAVGSNQNEKFLLVVGADDMVESRPVKLGGLFGSFRAIDDGIKADERVIDAGLQMIMPGMKVAPRLQQVDPASADLTGPETPATQPAPAPAAKESNQ